MIIKAVDCKPLNNDRINIKSIGYILDYICGKNIYSRNITVERTLTNNDATNSLMMMLLMKNVKKLLQKNKMNTSPEPDELCVEFYKTVLYLIGRLITDLYHEWLNEGVLSQIDRVNLRYYF